jgi:hypothetical protein
MIAYLFRYLLDFGVFRVEEALYLTLQGLAYPVRMAEVLDHLGGKIAVNSGVEEEQLGLVPED